MTDTQSTSSIDLILSETTLYNLKRELFHSWIYADIDFVIEDETIPSQAFRILRRISNGLSAISIMSAGDHDRDQVWGAVRQYLTHLIDAGWTLHSGDDHGVLCIRIVDPLAVGHGDEVNVVVPHEGRRQLRGLEGWCNSLAYMN